MRSAHERASQWRRARRSGWASAAAGRIGVGLLAWVVGLIWIFPVAWTVFTSFKTEQDAADQTLSHGLVARSATTR